MKVFLHQVLCIAITALYGGLYRRVTEVIDDVLLRPKAEQGMDYPRVASEVQRSLSVAVGRVDIYM